jgi:hypothetical protein
VGEHDRARPAESWYWNLVGYAMTICVDDANTLTAKVLGQTIDSFYVKGT